MIFQDVRQIETQVTSNDMATFLFLYDNALPKLPIMLSENLKIFIVSLLVQNYCNS